MKKPILTLVVILAAATAALTRRPAGPRKSEKESEFTGRKLEPSSTAARRSGVCGSRKKIHSWCFIRSRRRPNAPLYVVLHSAGHDVHSCLACTTKVGNHDIYHSPPDFFALYVDCKANKGDWWWGINKYPGPRGQPHGKTGHRHGEMGHQAIRHRREPRLPVREFDGRQRHAGNRHAPRRRLRGHQGECARRGQHVSSRMYFPPRTSAGGRHPSRPADRRRLFRPERRLVPQVTTASSRP